MMKWSDWLIIYSNAILLKSVKQEKENHMKKQQINLLFIKIFQDSRGAYKATIYATKTRVKTKAAELYTMYVFFPGILKFKVFILCLNFGIHR